MNRLSVQLHTLSPQTRAIAVDPVCDVCNLPTDDPHFPHVVYCGGKTDPLCTCDRTTCATCCPCSHVDAGKGPQ